MKPTRPPTRLPQGFDPIENIIADVRRGRLVILTDDASRENEGDLVLAAEKTTPAKVNFMARFGRGLICAPLTQARAQQLGLQRMVLENRESWKTDFTVSVDGAPRHGVGTGISAQDRSRTIRLLASPATHPSDLVQPGHVFPLQAKEGGVLQRAGHTEAAVDLARLAGLDPSAVICEILKEDGTMARLPDLRRFAARHKIRLAAIQDLIEYRRSKEKLVVREETVPFASEYGNFQLHLYRSVIDGNHHLALTLGDISPHRPVLVRVHSDSLLEDLFGLQAAAPRHSVRDALEMIRAAGCGVLVYMRHDDHGAALVHKVRSLRALPPEPAPRSLKTRPPAPDALREYGLGAQILLDLGVRRIRLLTHSPKNVIGLSGYGLELAEQISITSRK